MTMEHVRNNVFPGDIAITLSRTTNEFYARRKSPSKSGFIGIN